jgi:hypothetical protein
MYDLINDIFEFKPIKSTFCTLTPVDIRDAQLIVELRSLRQDFLKKSNLTIENQTAYLEGYLQRYKLKEEVYFKISHNESKVEFGVTRITKLTSPDNFGFESGVMFLNCPPNLYLDAYFLCLRLGFDIFEKDYSGPWSVDKNNKRMLSIHKRIGIAEITGEDEDYIYLIADKKKYDMKIGDFMKLGFGIMEGYDVNTQS